MRTTLAILGGSLACALTLSACKREERTYRVEPPFATRIDAKQVGQLVAGPGTPKAPAENAYDNNAYAMAEGKRLYGAMNCVGCHAHGGGGIGPPLIDDKWIYGHQPAQIFATIVEGRPNGMPSYRHHLADYQVWELAAYVRSLSGLASSMAAGGRDDDLKGGKPENSVSRSAPQSTANPQPADHP